MNHTTKAGTVLPLLKLKGKDYLEVKYRLVWFREEHPTWAIETSFVSIEDRSACARAVIKDDQGRVVATSHKKETAANFPDFIEKSETGSIGRALALIGYGTQFCADELDEGERIVDSPAARSAPARVAASVPGVTAAASQHQSQGAQSQGGVVPCCELCGAVMQLSRNHDAYTCPNWKDKSRGNHSYVNI